MNNLELSDMKYPKCLIGTIVSPGEYVVLSKDKKHYYEIKDIERSLNDEFYWDPGETHNFCTLMWVATRTSDSKKTLKRGIIESITENFKYKIFLTDYGHFMEVDKSLLRPITDKRFIEAEPLAYRVKLYGILPVETVIVNGHVRRRLCQKWSKSAIKYVEKIFTKNPQVVVKSQMLQDRNVYGDLYLKFDPDEKYQSLKKLLCKYEYGAYSETYFLKHENLFVATDCSEGELKMKAVEKWQQEHFGTSEVCRKPLYLFSEVGSDNEDHSYLSSSWENQSDDSFPSPKEYETKECSKNTSELQHPLKSFGRGQVLERTVKALKAKLAEKAIEGQLVREAHNKKAKSIGRGVLLKQTKPLQPKVELDHSEKSSPINLYDKDFLQNSYHNCSSQLEENKLIKCDKMELENDPKNREDDKSAVNRSRAEILNLRKFHLNNKKGKHDETPEVNVKEVTERIQKTQNFWAPFILFQDSVVEPMDFFRQLPIKLSLIKNLEKGGHFDNLSPLQRWAIPTIRKQHNLVMIGSPKTGKTLSYILCLMDYIQDKSYFEELPDGNGPCVVIVCFSSTVCESVYHLCHRLLGYRSEPPIENCSVKILMAHGGGCEEKYWAKLTNGCDILISTPHCLARILEQPSLTNFERLSVLVLDEIDVISQEPFRRKTLYILEKAKASVKNHYCQKIFCGEKWTPAVESLVHSYLKSKALIIGSYMEEAIYKKIIPHLYLVSKMEKQKLLLDLLSELNHENVLLICGKVDEATSVEKILADIDIQSLVVHENMWASEINDILKVWKSSSPRPILITTDELLSEVEIKDIYTLIHYSFPYKSKTNFFLRYSAFRKIVPLSNKSNNQKSNLKDIILVDDENHYQLPHIIDFVTRLGGEVPQKILEKCEEIRRQVEAQKIESMPLCRSLIAFGSCRSFRTCPLRHAFVRARDSTEALPSSGSVSFLVTKFHDASFFSARLIEHTSEKGESIRFDNEVSKISKQMLDFYSLEKNRRPLGEITMGQFCAVKCFDEIFVRAEVIEFLQLDDNDKPTVVNVRLMDQGDIRQFQSIQLYELPQYLSSILPQAVDVVVVGVQPVDYDVNWSQVANNVAESILTQPLAEDQYWTGNIVLSLKNTLFLQPVMIKRLLPSLNIRVVDSLVQEQYISQKIAFANENHLPAIRKLCTEGGIEILNLKEEKNEGEKDGTEKKNEKDKEGTQKEKEEEKKEKNNLEMEKKEEEKELPERNEENEEEIERTEIEKQKSIKSIDLAKPTWTSFDKNIVSVKFLAAKSLTSVFFQVKKFVETTLELNQHCQTEGDKTVKDLKLLKNNGVDVPELSAGMFCLARYESMWNRGRIDRDDGTAFFIFFVDLGLSSSVSKEDVVSISSALLVGYPCQAIECRLVGFKSINQFTEKLKEKIESFAKLWLDDLYVVVANTNSKSDLTTGLKYAVNVINASGKSLNKILAQEEDIILEETEKQFLEDYPIEEGKSVKDFDEASEIQKETKNILEEEEKEKQVEISGAQESLGEENEDKKNEDKVNDLLYKDALQVINELTSNIFDSALEEECPDEFKENNLVTNDSFKTPNLVTKIEEDLPEVNENNYENAKQLSTATQKHRNHGHLTPKVLWSQSLSKIQLKIEVESVDDYKLECSYREMKFRCSKCSAQQKTYGFRLKMFSGIDVSSVTVSVQAFRVIVKANKFSYFTWPRLTEKGRRYWWLRRDVEGEERESDFIRDYIESVKADLKQGIVKEPFNAEGPIQSIDWDDSEEGGYDSNESDSY